MYYYLTILLFLLVSASLAISLYNVLKSIHHLVCIHVVQLNPYSSLKEYKIVVNTLLQSLTQDQKCKDIVHWYLSLSHFDASHNSNEQYFVVQGWSRYQFLAHLLLDHQLQSLFHFIHFLTKDFAACQILLRLHFCLKPNVQFYIRFQASSSLNLKGSVCFFSKLSYLLMFHPLLCCVQHVFLAYEIWHQVFYFSDCFSLWKKRQLDVAFVELFLIIYFSFYYTALLVFFQELGKLFCSKVTDHFQAKQVTCIQVHENFAVLFKVIPEKYLVPYLHQI